LSIEKIGAKRYRAYLKLQAKEEKYAPYQKAKGKFIALF